MDDQRHNQRYNSHTCVHIDVQADCMKKKLDLLSGSQRHRNFGEFFNVPVQAPTRGKPFTVIPRFAPFQSPFTTLMGICPILVLIPQGPHGCA